MATRHLVPTVIVSGFPAIGKSFLAKKFPILARDLESSDFHWKKTPTGEWELDENGNKIPNEKWPANYIENIKALEKSGMYRIVFVSSHELIRKEMAKAKIRYSNIFPENTPEMKKVILDRCKLRHSPPEFIENLSENWDSYIDSLVNDTGAVKNVQLNPQSINIWSGWIFME